MVVDVVDGEGVEVGSGRLEQDEALSRRVCRGLAAERVAKVDERQPAPADGGEGGPADGLHPDRAAPDPDDLLDRRAGNGVDLAGRADGERRDDGEGERDPEGEDDPLPAPALDLDEAADPLDVGAHHVHADAPAGKVGHRSGGREPGLEDQAMLLRLAQPLGPLGGQHPGGDRPAGELVPVDAGAVVGDLEQDLVSRLPSADPQAAGFPLAGREPRRGAFDAVIDGVADDVGERVPDHLEHLAVDLDVAAVDLEGDLLAGLAGNVADHPRQRREQIVDALHPGAGDRVAKVGDGGGDPVEGGFHLHVAARPDPAGELVAGQDEIGDAAHHPVEQVDGKPDGPAGGSGRALLAGADSGIERLDRPVDGQGIDERAVVLARQVLARLEGLDQLGEAVDDGEDGADQRRVRAAGCRRGRRRVRPRRRGSGPGSGAARRSRYCP
jgi:hypothetical protein